MSTVSKSISSLGNAVFNATNAFHENTKRSNAHGIIQLTPVYKFPAGLSSDEKLNILAILTASGKSTDEGHTAWTSWVLSYCVLSFSEMENTIRRDGSREIQFTDLPKDFVTWCKAFSSWATQLEEAPSEEAVKEYQNSCPWPSALPAATLEDIVPELLSSATIPGIYGYMSLILFMCGKRMTDLNARAVSENRPRAIIQTFQAEDAGYILTGDGKISTSNYKYVNLAWTRAHGARHVIVAECSTFANGSTLAQRVVYTTFRLLEFSGMQPAFYIHRFLEAHPWAPEISILRASISYYAESLRELARTPNHMQPYYKVVNGANSRAFHRQNILPLTAVAMQFERITNPTLRSYTMGEGADAAVNAFNTEAVSKGYTALQRSADNEPTV